MKLQTQFWPTVVNHKQIIFVVHHKQLESIVKVRQWTNCASVCTLRSLKYVHTCMVNAIIIGGSICNDGELRLNGGQSQTEGIVEICFGGVWGTICDDGWDDSDARVACRQLGYSHGYGTWTTLVTAF